MGKGVRRRRGCLRWWSGGAWTGGVVGEEDVEGSLGGMRDIRCL